MLSHNTRMLSIAMGLDEFIRCAFVDTRAHALALQELAPLAADQFAQVDDDGNPVLYRDVDGHMLIVAPPAEGARSVGIVLHSSLRPLFRRARVRDRTVSVELEAGGSRERPLLLLSSHLPHHGHSEDAYNDALAEVGSLLLNSRGAVVWALDANAELGSDVPPGMERDDGMCTVSGAYGHGQLDNRGVVFGSFLAAHGLCATGSWGPGMARPSYTPDGGGTSKLIDYVCIDQRTFQSGFAYALADDLPHHSDHTPLAVSMELPVRLPRGHRRQRVPRGWRPRDLRAF